MKMAFFSVLTCGLLFAHLHGGVQEQVQYIRDIYEQTNEEIERGDLYRTTVDINADELSYPAVGTYHPVLDFYFGYSEENPYPDNLRKAILVVDRAAYHEYSEFLYDGYNNLIFVYVTGSPEMPEMRFYYSQGDVVKIVQESESLTSFTTEQMDLSRSFYDKGERLVDTFHRLFF